MEEYNSDLQEAMEAKVRKYIEDSSRTVVDQLASALLDQNWFRNASVDEATKGAVDLAFEMLKNLTTKDPLIAFDAPLEVNELLVLPCYVEFQIGGAFQELRLLFYEDPYRFVSNPLKEKQAKETNRMVPTVVQKEPQRRRLLGTGTVR